MKITRIFFLVASMVAMQYGNVMAQKISNASASILKDIRGSIEIKLYISENLPDTMSGLKNDLEDLMKGYQKESGNKVAYSFINPDKATKREFFFFQENFTEFQVVKEVNGLYRYRSVYSGAILHYGSSVSVLPEITADMPLEYVFTSSIRRLLEHDKKLVGLIYGHGEPTFTSFKEFGKKYADLFRFEPVNLEYKPDLSGYDALLLISPRELIDGGHLDQLDQYLSNGGNMLVCIDRVNVDNATKQGVSLLTGVGSWLDEHGINIRKEFVVDENCGLVMVNQGAFKMPISLPYLPSIETFPNHPVTNDLSRVVLRFPSPVEIDPKKKYTYQELMQTSDKAQTYMSPFLINYNKIWNSMEFTKYDIPLAYAIEGKFGSKQDSRVIVVADGDYLLDEQRDFVEDSDNLKFLFNAVEWLTDDIGLMNLKK